MIKTMCTCKQLKKFGYPDKSIKHTPHCANSTKKPLERNFKPLKA